MIYCALKGGEGTPIKVHARDYIRVLSLATGFLFFSFLARFSYGVLVPRLIDDLGFSRAEAGSIFSMYMMMYSVFSVISGRMFDRYGVKVVVVLSLVYGLGMVLASASTSFPTLAISLAIAGLGASSSWTPMVALVSSNLPGSWRGRGVGLLEIGIRISHGAAGLLIPPIALIASWRSTLWMLATPLFAYGLAFYVLSSRSLLKFGSNRSKDLAGYRAILALRRFWLIGLSYSSMSFASYIILTFFVDFLEREARMSYVEASAMSSLMGFIGIVGALLLAWISDKAGKIAVLALGNAVTAICVYLMSLLPGNVALLSSLGFVIAIYGIFFGALWPIYAACAVDVAPSSVGTVLGLWTLMMGVSALAAPVIGGFIADVAESYVTAFQLSAIAYIAAIALLLSLILKANRE